jgi:hypothetical protein
MSSPPIYFCCADCGFSAGRLYYLRGQELRLRSIRCLACALAQTGCVAACSQTAAGSGLFYWHPASYDALATNAELCRLDARPGTPEGWRAWLALDDGAGAARARALDDADCPS